VAVRALRGATQVAADDRDAILAATRELVAAVLDENGLAPDDVISILFTATLDLTAQAPALAARQLGLDDVALLCAQEMHVPSSLPRVVRLLAHVDTARPRTQLRNVYLNGTDVLRETPEAPR
jgi:chorismate mutase